MIKSMTGYGAAKGFSGDIEISIELKSVNSRYFDCSVKLPRVYIAFEEPIKALVQKHISRGKIDVFVTIDTSKADDVDVKINRPLAAAYITAMRALALEYDIIDNIGVMELARFPDVLQIEKREADSELLCNDISEVAKCALMSFDEMRAREGKKLQADIESRLGCIESLLLTVEEISPRSVEEYTVKLEARMREVLESIEIDEQRILQEAAIFADRVAINEETVRLKSHLTQLREMLASAEPVGRKMDFLVQELNREANTIGSKGHDTEMARAVVEIKSEVEKIREQAQNVE